MPVVVSRVLTVPEPGAPAQPDPNLMTPRTQGKTRSAIVTRFSAPTRPGRVFGGSVECRRRSPWCGERRARRRGRVARCPGAAAPCCSAGGIRSGWRASVPRRGSARGPGLRRPLVSYLLAASLRYQARSVAGVTGKTSLQRPRGMSRGGAASQARSAGSQRARPTWRRSTAFSCRSTSNSASFARSPRHSRTARPSIRHVSM